jgi:hypothetical protein
MLIFGQRHLRHMLAENACHYDQQRPYRGQALRPPSPARPISTHEPMEIVRRPILGGLINEWAVSSERRNTGVARELRWFTVDGVWRLRQRSGNSSHG